MFDSINFRLLTLSMKGSKSSSKGTINEVKSLLLRIKSGENYAYGEICSFADPRPFEEIICEAMSFAENFLPQTLEGSEPYSKNSKIYFAFDQAIQDLNKSCESNNTERFLNNHGLIWLNELAALEKHVAELYIHGYRVLKIKLLNTQNLDQELAAITEVISRYSDLKIRIACNSTFNIDSLNRVTDKLSKLPIISLEDPLKDINEYQELNSNLPIYYDFCLRNSSQLLTTFNKFKPTGIVIRPPILGTSANCHKFIAYLIKEKIDFYISSTLESNISLACLFKLALEYPDVCHGLGTGKNFLDQNSIITDTKGKYSLQSNFNPESLWNIADEI